MKTIAITLLIVTIIILSGCTPYPSDVLPSGSDSTTELNNMYDQIETGMSFDQVRALLGEPTQVHKAETDLSTMLDAKTLEAAKEMNMTIKTTVESWSYSKGNNILQITFINEKVSGKVVV